MANNIESEYEKQKQDFLKSNKDISIGVKSEDNDRSKKKKNRDLVGSLKSLGNNFSEKENEIVNYPNL